MSDATKPCDHTGCTCTVSEQADSVSENGRLFCSTACRDGEGCGHGGCNCKAFAEATENATG